VSTYGDLESTRHLVVAVSGGADSLALAWASAFVLPRLGFRGEAVIIDHQLQDDSADVASRAQLTVEQWGMPATIIPVTVEGSGNVEENARIARYDTIEAFASERGAAGVLLGHTLNDQAETVLLGLTRGSGPASIRGMSPRRGVWLRPFLVVTRDQTRQACLDAGIEWWDDPHNVDRRFVRPRLRHDLLPVMEEVVGPGVAQALAQTAHLVSADDDYLNAVATEHLATLETPAGHLLAEPLSALPDPIRRRVLRGWVKKHTGVSMSFSHTQMVDALVVDWSGQGPVAISGSKLVRHNGHLVIEATPTTLQN